ncbi:hypothetical protein [Bacteriovorax sp. Seq25_V]|uniref:hypothetical protein n=1 Tax=Bacteriovorax sp. Seq25_V TaxID=1201288 RepID=UPI000389F278|nr:hypothetical protein [Bacteriovorax sp. Seq25_V]EQC43586.1 hypothetical protein M900_0103 [Bacteriovorax sp. Seq25_V]
MIAIQILTIIILVAFYTMKDSKISTALSLVGTILLVISLENNSEVFMTYFCILSLVFFLVLSTFAHTFPSLQEEKSFGMNRYGLVTKLIVIILLIALLNILNSSSFNFFEPDKAVDISQKLTAQRLIKIFAPMLMVISIVFSQLRDSND